MGPGNAITIDLTDDLAPHSDLAQLIPGSGKAILHLASVLAQHAGKNISNAVGKSSPTLTVTASPQWNAGPVTFSLTQKATCTMTIAAQGEDFEVAMNIDDTSKTTNVQLPATGMTFVNIDLDFSLTGEIAEGGTASGLTISGKECGNSTRTLSFCQPVPSDTETIAALKMALSGIVFPTGPEAVARMAPGSSCRMAFDGALSWELDLSYGLADHQLSAPGAGNVISSIQQVMPSGITAPAVTVEGAVTASMKYSHTGHFAIVVTKPHANAANLYLTKASAAEIDGSVGVSVGIAVTPLAVAVDPTKMQSAVQSLTGSSKLATNVLNKITPQIDNFASSRLTCLNKAITAANGDAGLSLALSKQTARTTLFNYQVDLTQPLAAQNWDQLFRRNIADARNIPGFTLIAGSGVEQKLRRSATLEFHFFNLCQYSKDVEFFDNCYSELATDGTIRIVYDIGISATVKKNQSVDTVRFHFRATATEDVLAKVSNPDIDLIIEISEKGDPRNAAVLTNILGIVNQASLKPVIDTMNAWLTRHPSGTLSLVAVLKPSAYGRLTYSPYSNGKPQANQSLDAANWTAIHLAAVHLMGNNLPFLATFSYFDWQSWNAYCTDGQPEAIADRRHSGPHTAVPSPFWKGYPAPLVDCFLRASADGMNLFEDCVRLAGAAVTTEAEWQAVKDYVVKIVEGDGNTDYSKPIAAAILSRAAADASAQMAVDTAHSQDASSFTTTLTIS